MDPLRVAFITGLACRMDLDLGPRQLRIHPSMSWTTIKKVITHRRRTPYRTLT